MNVYCASRETDSLLLICIDRCCLAFTPKELFVLLPGKLLESFCKIWSDLSTILSALSSQSTSSLPQISRGLGRLIVNYTSDLACISLYVSQIYLDDKKTS